jgi:hypothetical protein
MCVCVCARAGIEVPISELLRNHVSDISLESEFGVETFANVTDKQQLLFSSDYGCEL